MHVIVQIANAHNKHLLLETMQTWLGSGGVEGCG